MRFLWTQLVLNGAPPQNTNAYFTMVGSDIEAMITSGVDDSTILKTLTLLPFLANRARMAMDSMQPLHGRPSAASVEAGMVSAEATEPVEAVGVGDSQVVGGNGSMDSGGIAGAGGQLGTAEDVEEEVVGKCGTQKGEIACLYDETFLRGRRAGGKKECKWCPYGAMVQKSGTNHSSPFLASHNQYHRPQHRV